MYLRFLAVLTAALFGFSVTHGATVNFRAIAVEGNVTFTLKGTQSKQPVSMGMEIPVNSTLNTGVDGNIILQQGSTFTMMQVKPNSSVRLDRSDRTETASNTKLHVTRGTMMYKVDKLKSTDSTFEVDTPLATGAVQGTEFFICVSENGKLVLVYTREGAVGWKPKPGVVQLKKLIDIAKGENIPTDVLRALFDFGKAQAIAQKQAFLFIPKDSTDFKYKPAYDPVKSMDQFIDLLKKLGFTQIQIIVNPPKPPPQIPNCPLPFITEATKDATYDWNVALPNPYKIHATANPTSYTATGLPDGLKLNPATGEITGTPTKGGTYTVTFTATNKCGTCKEPKKVTFIIKCPPPTSSVSGC